MKKRKKITNRKNAQSINKNMSFSEILEKHPELAEELLGEGLHCVGCPMAAGENLEQGAMMHGINPDKLTAKLNKKIKSKNKKSRRK